MWGLPCFGFWRQNVEACPSDLVGTTHEDTSVVEATTTDEVGKRSSGMELKAAVEVDGRGDSNVSGFGIVTSKHAPRTLLEEQAE